MKIASWVWIVAIGLLLGGCRTEDVQEPSPETPSTSLDISSVWSKSVQLMVPPALTRLQTVSVVEVSDLTDSQWRLCLANPMLLDTVRNFGNSSWPVRSKTAYVYDGQKRISLVSWSSPGNRKYEYSYRYNGGEAYVNGSNYSEKPIADTLLLNALGFALRRTFPTGYPVLRAKFRYKYDDDGNLVNEDHQTITRCSGMPMQITVDHTVTGENRTSSLMQSAFGWGAEPTRKHTITYSYNLSQRNSGLPYLEYNLLDCSGMLYEFGYYNAADYGTSSRNLIKRVVAITQDTGFDAKRQYVYNYFYAFDAKGRVKEQLISQRVLSGTGDTVYSYNIRKHTYTYTD